MKNLPAILKDRYTAALFLLGALFLIVAFAVAYVNILDSRSLLVIHFDAYRGADFFGDRTDIVDILLIAGLVLLLNFFLANELYFRERILSYILAGSTLAFVVLILVAVNVIINVN